VPDAGDADAAAELAMDEELTGTIYDNGEVTDYLVAGFRSMREVRATVTFDLAPLLEGAQSPSDLEVTSAVFHIYQTENPFNDMFQYGQHAVVSHVRSDAFTESFFAPKIQTTLADVVLATTNEEGWRTVDVTLPVRYELADCQQQVQLRIQAAPEATKGVVGFTGEAHDQLYGTGPYLEVRYRQR
jgi:hypothetical protein